MIEQNPTRKNLFAPKSLAVMAVLIALAVIVRFVHFPLLPSAPFLEYDPGAIFLVIAGYMFGISGGLIVTVLAVLLHNLVGGMASGPYGVIMDLLSMICLVILSSLIVTLLTRRSQEASQKQVVVALVIASVVCVAAVTALMVPANLLITPKFMGVPISAVRAMIWFPIIPFNLLKHGINMFISSVIWLLVRRRLAYN